MKILLTNNHLARFGGSERWTETIYNTLSKDHTVHVYVPGRNLAFPHMYPFDPAVKYDLLLANHNVPFNHMRERAQFSKSIFTSHGIIPTLEKPVPGADHYVAVSEEVANHHQGYEWTVIRNPVDMNVFQPRQQMSEKLSKVLFISNNQRAALNVVRQASRGLTIKAVGGNYQVRDVQEVINWADLVISLGRGCYEALSCGRNVVVYDVHGGDGFVTPESILDFRLNNCSGRFNKFRWSYAELRAEMERYDPGLSADLRTYAEENHDATKIAQQYLELI